MIDGPCRVHSRRQVASKGSGTGMDIRETTPMAAPTLEVENFGPITRANVELRPMTIFVGPSNTGKSYLATLAYALHKSLSANRFIGFSTPGGHSVTQLKGHGLLADGPQSMSLTTWIRRLTEDGAPRLTPDHLARLILPILEQTDALDQLVESELTRCFGVDRSSHLIRRTGSQQKSRIVLRIPRGNERTFPSVDETGAEAVRYQFEFSRRRSHGSLSVAPPLYLRTEHIGLLRELLRLGGLRAGRSNEVSGLDLEHLVGQAVQLLYLSVFHPLTNGAFYLPAIRSGVMHIHQTVVSALIHGATAAGRRPMAEVPMLSGVLADFLDDLLTIGSNPSQHRLGSRPVSRRESAGKGKNFKVLAESLEDRILLGSIELDPGEITHSAFRYRPAGWTHDLPLTGASSMVSELAPVVLYLRHLVEPGDLFIIEEPESHLHPEMQAAFARELAGLVRAGVRVLLTTHSEWFLEQIGNLVALSSLPKASRTGFPGADATLEPEEVGVWRFTSKQRPRGSVVSEIRVDPETGTFPAGYDEIGEQLYNDGARMFNILQGASAG